MLGNLTFFEKSSLCKDLIIEIESPSMCFNFKNLKLPDFISLIKFQSIIFIFMLWLRQSKAFVVDKIFVQLT